MNKTMNEHFRAAAGMAEILPNLFTRAMKKLQQQAILRELLAGLKGGR